MTWQDITLRKWNEIESIYKKEYEDEILQTADIIAVVFDVSNPMELSPQKFSKYVAELDFLKNPIPDKKLCNTYTINGTKYNFKGNIMEVSMGQLMDWRQFSTQVPLDYAQCLSIFMIPDEHKYNDGYDMEKTIDDINCLPIADVIKLWSFFLAAQILFTETLINYFKRQMKKTNLPKEKKQEIEEKLMELNTLWASISSLTPSAIAK